MGHQKVVSCGNAKVDELGILERQVTQPSAASQGQEAGWFLTNARLQLQPVIDNYSSIAYWSLLVVVVVSSIFSLFFILLVVVVGGVVVVVVAVVLLLFVVVVVVVVLVMRVGIMPWRSSGSTEHAHGEWQF